MPTDPAADPQTTGVEPADTPAREPTLQEIEFHGCVAQHRPPIAIKGLVDPPAELPIPFDPVPRLRQRRNGWTEERQRAFIAALAECASVSRAARAVGVSARSAYRLLGAPGAESFAHAWDQAIAWAADAIRWGALDPALHGTWVPVMRKGRLVRTELRYNDRLAIALLGGRNGGSVTEQREQAASRRRYRQFLADHAAAQAAAKRAEEEAAAAYQAELDAMMEKARQMRGPRIRFL